MKPKISLIAAIGKNRELGKGNTLLWDIPEDMKHFRETTRGHVVVMGRKTFKSIGRPLPNRVNIIVSRDKNYQVPEECLKVASIEEAIEKAIPREKSEVFIIGGAQIYSLALPYADKLYITRVDKEFPEADVFFPDYSEFNKVISERTSSDENFSYTFLELTK